MLQISIDNLIAAGYKRYNDAFQKDINIYIGSFQKKVKDDRGIKYFIDVNVYNHEGMPGYDCDTWGKFGYEATCQFNSHAKHKHTFNVLRFVKAEDKIEEIEDFFHVMFHSMECEYYEGFEYILIDNPE